MEFIYLKELEELAQILALAASLSLGICFVTEQTKTLKFKQSYIYTLINLIVSISFAFLFKYTFAYESLNNLKTVWLSIALFGSSCGLYSYLENANGFIAKRFKSLSEYTNELDVKTLGDGVKQATSVEIKSSNELKSEKPLKYKVGDILYFSGGMHNTKAYDDIDNKKYKASNGLCKVEIVNIDGVYNYHCVGYSKDGYVKSNVYGWVSEEALSDKLPPKIKEEFAFPLPYIAITQYFSSAHRGIDFGWNSARGYSSNMKITSATKGIVMRAGWFGGAGNTVWIRHNDKARNRAIWTLYKHLSEISVNVGDELDCGDIVGRMGDTGVESRGAHLHFDMLITPYDYNYSQSYEDRIKYSVNPLEYLRLSTSNTCSYDKSALKGVK